MRHVQRFNWDSLSIFFHQCCIQKETNPSYTPRLIRYSARGRCYIITYMRTRLLECGMHVGYRYNKRKGRCYNIDMFRSSLRHNSSSIDKHTHTLRGLDELIIACAQFHNEIRRWFKSCTTPKRMLQLEIRCCRIMILNCLIDWASSLKKYIHALSPYDPPEPGDEWGQTVWVFILFSLFTFHFMMTNSSSEVFLWMCMN